MSGDSLTNNYTSASFADKNVGTAKTVSVSGISISGTDAGNYSLANTTASTTADITPKGVTPSITADNKTYDGTTAATFTCSLSGVIGTVDVTCTGGTATFVNKNVGTGKNVNATGLGLGGADAGNYTINDTAYATANITARVLIVSAHGVNKVYDGFVAATVTLTDDRVSGDVFTDSYTSAASADKTVANGKSVSVSGISISGTDAGNYALLNTSASTTANITQRPLTVTATGVNRVYDGTTNATVTLSDNRVTGDVFTDSYTSAAFTDKNVGTGKTVNVSGISIGGSDAGNYALQNATAITTANITQRPITITADAKSKVYGTADPALTYQLTSGSLANGDGFSGSLSRAAGESVANSPYAILQGSVTAGSNYNLNYVGASLTINAANTTTSAGNKTATFGDPSVTLTATVLAVAPSTAAVNEGTVTFVVKQGSTTLAIITSGAVANGAAQATLNLDAPFVVGSYSINATYNPAATSPNFNGSTASATTLTMAQKTTALALTQLASVQYSDPATLVATVSPPTLNSQTIAGTVQFFVDGVSVGSAAVNASGVATLTPLITNAPGSHSVTATFTSSNANFTGSTSPTPATLTVTQEDARAYYTGNTLFWATSTSASSAVVGLAATIKDITAVPTRTNTLGQSETEPAYEPNAGIISNAKVTFVNRDTMTDIAGCVNLPVVLVNVNDVKVGTASCNPTLSINTTQGATLYTIGIRVSNYYVRDDATENTTIDVALPLTSNFITGGGYLLESKSAGQYAADPGTKSNFGFNVKYNKGGTNLQGNVNIVIRKGGRVYQIKSNSLTSLGVNPSPCAQATATNLCQANFVSKSNLQDITNPTAPISLGGNLTLQMNMHDNGEPGSSDTISFSLYDGSTVLFSSNWDGTKTVEQMLGGGNTVVH